MPYANPEIRREKAREYTRVWRARHPETVKQAHADWRKKNPEAVRQKKRRHYLRNREKIIARSVRNEARRVEADPGFRLQKNLRRRISLAIAGKNKSARTVELLGCPVAWLEVHLESLFHSGMDWKNYGSVWHVDHIKPCASFDLTRPEQQKICFHWTNLQPLFAEDNLKKGSHVL